MWFPSGPACGGPAQGFSEPGSHSGPGRRILNCGKITSVRNAFYWTRIKNNLFLINCFCATVFFAVAIIIFKLLKPRYYKFLELTQECRYVDEI